MAQNRQSYPKLKRSGCLSDNLKYTPSQTTLIYRVNGEFIEIVAILDNRQG